MARSDTESKAITYIEDLISDTSHLQCNISRADKIISWDGFIFIHGDTNKETKKDVKKIDVQVKGTKTAEPFKDSIKYPVSIDDLKNYQQNGGTLYFVVKINKKERAGYYCELLPITIKHLMEKENKSTVNVELKKLPTDPNEFEMLVRNFKQKSDLQANGNSLTMEDAVKNHLDIKQKVYFPKNVDPLRYIANNEAALYAVQKIGDSEITIPIDTYGIEQFYEKRINKTVKINNEEYYNSYKMVYQKDSETIKFSENVYIKKDSNGITFNYRNFNIIENIINDGPFVLSAYRNKKIEINGVCFNLSSKNTKNDEKSLDFISDILNVANKIKRVFEYYNLNYKKIDISKMTKGDKEILDLLINNVIEKKTLTDNKYQYEYILAELLGCKFMLIVKENSNKTYNIYDLLEYNGAVYQDHEGTEIESNKYNLFDADIYFSLSNFNIEKAVSSLKKFVRNDFGFGAAHCFALEMINHYDKTNEIKYLNEASKLFNWLYSKNKYNIDDNYKQINKLQIIARRRKFNKKEIESLKELTKHTEIEIKYASYLLLGNKEKAIENYNKMAPEVKELYDKLPISFFMISDSK